MKRVVLFIHTVARYARAKLDRICPEGYQDYSGFHFGKQPL